MLGTLGSGREFMVRGTLPWSSPIATLILFNPVHCLVSSLSAHSDGLGLIRSNHISQDKRTIRSLLVGFKKPLILGKTIQCYHELNTGMCAHQYV
ncbi:hypothetical protein F4810DRAFT_664767 [Camillea tinctor]|nr:hypothetical protein F4810DRAFT_664767 [Camillea tinctor]